MNIPAPPPIVQDLVDVVGLDQALLLIEEFGGAELWIPSKRPGTHQAVRDRFEAKFGKDMTDALSLHFGGGEILVPLCKAWRMQIYLARGMGAREIARKLQCSRVTVWRRQMREQAINTVQSRLPF